MSEIATLKEVINVGLSYKPSDRIDEAEAARLAVLADEQMRTTNGDAGMVKVSARQLSLLLVAWYKAGRQ